MSKRKRQGSDTPSQAHVPSESAREAFKHSDQVAVAALRAVLGDTPAQAPAASTRFAEPASKKGRKKQARAAGEQARATALVDGGPALSDVERSVGTARASKKRRTVQATKNAHKPQAGTATASAPRAQPQHVDAVFVGDELFLRDPQTERVYSSTRDRRGRLVAVGRWLPDTQGIQFEEQPVKAFKAPAETPVHEVADVPSQPQRRRPALPEALAFECDAEDHCETSPAAYGDVKPFLNFLCRHLGKQPDKLRIYDPYYCAGSVVPHLQELGFPTVYNRNEDFYAAQAAGTLPEHDVVLTNPPYSGDHVPRLLTFCRNHTKPCLLLVPSYVHQKPYFAEAYSSVAHKPFFVVPKKRYNYWTPKGAGRGNPKVRKDGRTSPFVTLWHVNFGERNVELLKWWQASGYKKSPNLRVYKSAAAIPSQLLDTAAPRSKLRSTP